MNALGFEWDHRVVPVCLPTHPQAWLHAHFQHSMPLFIWDYAVLEGNPFSFSDVKTLLAGGSVKGHRPLDHAQIRTLFEASNRLGELVKNAAFSLSKPVFTTLNGIVARNDALEWGVFRGEGEELQCTPCVGLGEEGAHTPLPTRPGAPDLNRVFDAGVAYLHTLTPFERALAFFLFGAFQQFFFDGNKRSARLMMNGILMSNGIMAMTVPAEKVPVFNEKMGRFYRSKDATEIMAFLVEFAQCPPQSPS